MKKRIYKIAFVLTMAAMVFDWPVKTQAGRVPGKVVKGVFGACAGCAREEGAAAHAAEEAGVVGKDASKAAGEASKSSKTEKNFVEEYGDDIIDVAGDIYQPSSAPKIITCYDCNGEGAIYYVDDYGNVDIDDYGNPILYQCPTCGGYGQLRQ